MTAALIVLNVLAALLPTWGFLRLLLRAERSFAAAKQLVAVRGSAGATYGDEMGRANRSLLDVPREDVMRLRWDLIFVVVGLICGAVANIWSLVAPAH